MKKISLLFILLFQLIFVFGQIKTENKKGYGLATGGFKPNRQEIPTQPKTVNTNNQNYRNDCYKNFEFTVKNYGYNKDGKFYSWGVAVKNNYSKAVQLNYKLIVGNDKTSPCATYGTLTYYIKPGEIYTNDYGTLKALIVDNNAEQYRIEITDVCFEGQDCIKNGYADCNGGQKTIQNQQNGASTTRSSLNNNNISINHSTKLTVQDLANSLTKSQEERIKNFRDFFIQNGYKFLKEGKRPDDYTGYIIEFSDFIIQLFYDDEKEGANGNGIGSPVIKIRLNNMTSKNKVLKFLNNISSNGKVEITVEELTIIIF